jgi:hypothetical protein
VNVRRNTLPALTALTVIACSEAPLDVLVLPPADIEDDLADGLVGYWPLDDDSGAVAADHSGNGHHGQITGGTWLSDGRFSGGLRLVAGDAVTIRSFPAAAPSFTVATWIRLSGEQLAMNSQTWVSILSTENFVSGGWQLNIDNRLPRPRFDFAYWAPPLDGYLFVECECVEVDRWIHVAAVVDVEANRVTLYRDGSVGDEETRPADVPAGDSTLYFGRWNMDGRLLSGDLDDVAVWNRSLTSDEVIALQGRPTNVRAGRD